MTTVTELTQAQVQTWEQALAEMESLVTQMAEYEDLHPDAARMVRNWPHMQETLSGLPPRWRAMALEDLRRRTLAALETLREMKARKEAEQARWNAQVEALRREALEAIYTRWPELKEWQPVNWNHDFGAPDEPGPVLWVEFRLPGVGTAVRAQREGDDWRLYHQGKEVASVAQALGGWLWLMAEEQQRRKRQEEERRRQEMEEKKRRHEEEARRKRLVQQARRKTAKEWLQAASVAAWVDERWAEAQTYALLAIATALTSQCLGEG